MDGRPCLVTEYMPGGNLLERLLSAEVLSWPVRLQFAIDITAGMVYLHNLGALRRFT